MASLDDVYGELVAIRTLVESTNERIDQLSTQQSELIQTVDILSASVSKLSTSVSAIKGQLVEIETAVGGGGGAGKGTIEADVAELRQKLTDVASTMGTAVVNVHRDFAMVLQQVGPAFEQVQRTVAPFAEAVSGFTDDDSGRSASVPAQPHAAWNSDGHPPAYQYQHQQQHQQQLHHHQGATF